MTKELIKNIINASKEGNAIEVRNSIHAALGEKIKIALANKEQEVAKNLFKDKK